MNKYYFCYSENIAKKLNENGAKYITVANHVKTGKTFWLYESSDLITEVIEKWNRS